MDNFVFLYNVQLFSVFPARGSEMLKYVVVISGLVDSKTSGGKLGCLFQSRTSG